MKAQTLLTVGISVIIVLGILLLFGGKRDEFPGRRQGGGTWNRPELVR